MTKEYPMNKIEYILLHHTGANNTYGEIAAHTARTYPGHKFAYHYFIELDGTIRQGQKEGLVAPHAGFDLNDGSNVHNWNTIGVAVSGNYEISTMSPAVFASLVKVLKMLAKKHNVPREKILRHKDVARTLCPGKNYPYQQILAAVYEEKPQKKTETPKSNWYDTALEYCKKNGLMRGDEDGMRPNDPVTRAELAAVAMNLLEKIKLLLRGM